MPIMSTSEYRLMFKVEDTHWWYLSLQRVLTKLLVTVPQGSQILDAGCGTGRNSALVQELGLSVMSLDASSDALTLAKKRGLHRLKQGDITAMPFKSNHFDVILTCDVLGALPNLTLINKSITELLRVTKPGGICLVHVAALPWLFSTHDQAVSNVHRFTRSELRTLFEQAGWHVQKVSYRYMLLFPLVAGSKIWQKMRGLKAHHSDLALPSPLVNKTLNAVMKFEDSFLTHLNYPIGSSLLLTAKKPR